MRRRLRLTGVDDTIDVLSDFVSDGKCLRSTFAYLGWLAGAAPDDAAPRAAASFDLLRVFALLQDDVMDDSPLRRGRPAAHVRFAQCHRENGLNGSAERFGASAAVLLGDLCLVWAGQMMRESGSGDRALARAWPRYDAMRPKLAVGQFADLVNDAGERPTMEDVLDVARRKSGNYTVRRPCRSAVHWSAARKRRWDCSGATVRPAVRRSSCATTSSASSGPRR